jgi:DNA-binding IclR family transcriptional regulator
MAVIAPAGTPRKRTARPPARPARAEARYAVPALDKGLDALELLAREAAGLSLNEIARALGRTSSELFRMVLALTRRGLTAAAAPLMLELVHRTLQSCHLTVFYAGRVMVVGEVDSPDRYAFGMKVGALVGLTDTASGFVLLAFQNDSTRRAMLASHQEVEGELDVNAVQLARIVRDVASKGYAEVQSRQIRGVTNIAFPIKGPTGHAVAVLNVPYIERIDKKITPSIPDVKEMLREYAARLSLLMGYVSEA